MSGPVAEHSARLAAIAAWEVSGLRRAVRSLAAVADRLLPWRARLEGVARSLASGESWSGHAAGAAAAAAQELATVTWTVDAALEESLTAFERLAGEAVAAQVLAGEALALAAALPDGVDAALRETDRLAAAAVALVPGATGASPGPAVAAARDALSHAAAASAAAERAGAALAAVGAGDAFPPGDFAALAARVPLADPVCLPPTPTGPPEEVAAWWAALPLTAQLAALRAEPVALGGRDGLPAWARDLANRQLLSTALASPTTPPAAAATARVVARRIRAEEAAGRRVQLHLLDLTGDRAVLALGDLDTAGAIALLVPGIGNTPGDDLRGLVTDARAVADAARTADPRLPVATAVWLGYDTPGSPRDVVSRAPAWAGGAALAASLAGLDAAREAVARPDARTTVLGHSYGTVVVDEAADVAGPLAADAVVLLGSPGVEDDAASLGVPEVYDAASPADLVASLGWFGRTTGSPAYGSTGLPVDADTGHSEYYDRDRPTLPAIGEVVAGVRTPG
ncbi:alpha/beta hydrolase [Blastococcus deserti]|uniref:Alpha/beta hydrolase n=1 Tax=Blastococcus deserti TaxID=2259033 RepID=A0ABW4X8B1_9ACTN